jgi:putative membrane protein
MLFSNKLTQLTTNQYDKTRENLANERTFLAWMRTSIALMGFGFVIVKFSLFIKQLALMLGPDDLPDQQYSQVVGTIMIAIGILITLLAYIHFKKYELQLVKGEFYSSSLLILFLTLLIISGGIALLIYLFSI